MIYVNYINIWREVKYGKNTDDKKNAGGAGHKFRYLDTIYENMTVLAQKEEEEPTVFLAKNIQTGKIAVKKYVDADKIAVYAKLSRIEDIHLEKVYEYASDERRGIVLTEYIGGTTLEELLRTQGFMSVEEACHVLEALCQALKKVHEAGIIHRDINPKNIMVSNDGVIKLIDFGIAREKKEKQTQDTTILGTPGYAAPEQFGFGQTDEKADIYALGVLLNVLLTGSLPTEKVYEELPISAVIRRCIQMDAGARYQNVDELLADLELMNEPRAFGTQERNNKNDKKEHYVSTWLPGFRTGVTWKNVVAVIGYFFMLLASVIYIEECSATWYTACLETAAVFIFLWASTLLAANIGYWDRKWIFGKLPRIVMIIVRILLWIALFDCGMRLDEYVRYGLLGFVRK